MKFNFLGPIGIFEAGEAYAGVDTWKSFIGTENLAQYCMQPAPDARRLCSTTVSYTHLDVYKRQKYATDLSWSKTLQGRKAQLDDEQSRSVLDELIAATNAEFQDHPFLWQANKSLPGNPFGSNAQRLPNLPHCLLYTSRCV